MSLEGPAAPADDDWLIRPKMTGLAFGLRETIDAAGLRRVDPDQAQAGGESGC